MASKTFSVFQKCNPRMLAFLSLVCILTATSTHAGFEWVPQKPAAVPEPTPVPAVQKAPVQPQAQDLLMHESGSLSAEPMELQPLSPMPMAHEHEEAAALPEPVLKRKDFTPPVQNPEPQPVMEEPEAVAPEPKMEPVTTTRLVVPEDAPQNAIEATKEENKVEIDPLPMNQEAAMPAYSEVVGFGSDIPLALALRQIVPPEYGFSFGEGVNPGIRISWNGGKPWPEVVQDMIAPLGLSANIGSNAVIIYDEKHSNAAPAQAEQPAEPDAAPIEITKVEETPEIQRQNIQDPGPEPQAQTQEEEVIKVVELNATEEPMKIATAPKPEAIKATGQHSTIMARKKIWEAKEGESLKQTLTAWSKESNLDLTWNAAHDYTLESDILVAGDIQQAIKAMLRAGIDTETGPAMTFTNTSTGAKLVVDDADNTRS